MSVNSETLQMIGDSWAPDPACYLTNEEIARKP